MSRFRMANPNFFILECRSPMAERLLVCAARELVEALGKAHRGRPPRPETTSTTRGGGEEYFDRVEDEIEATVRALARAARTLIERVSAMWIWGITVTCRLCVCSACVARWGSASWRVSWSPSR